MKGFRCGGDANPVCFVDVKADLRFLFYLLILNAFRSLLFTNFRPSRDLSLCFIVGEDSDGNDDNKVSDEDPDKEVLAGSMDVMRHQAAVALSPLLNTPTTPLVPSQEDLLLGELTMLEYRCI